MGATKKQLPASKKGSEFSDSVKGFAEGLLPCDRTFLHYSNYFSVELISALHSLKTLSALIKEIHAFLLN